MNSLKRYIDRAVKREIRRHSDGEQTLKRATKEVYRFLLLLNHSKKTLSPEQMNAVDHCFDLLRRIPDLAELDEIQGKDNAHRALDKIDMLLERSGVYRHAGIKLNNLIGNVLSALVDYGKGA